jgi:1-acyl-sn-glycerol-3-phosphate acyltransferase
MLLSLRFAVSGLAVVLAALPFVVAMFCLTPLLLLGRWGEGVYFAAARRMCAAAWSAWAWIPFGFWQTPFECENERELLQSLEQKERIILIANHRSWSDIFVLFWLTRKTGSIHHSVYLAKRSLIYIPVVGWGMYLSGMLMLNRNWKSDQQMLRRAARRFVDHSFGYWVYMFPEGTRLKAETLRSSQEFQKKSGFPVHKEVLQPRTKGFSTLCEQLPDLTDVLDVSIAYKGESGSFVPFLAGYCRGVRIKATLTQAPIQDPEKFLYDSFASKESWLKSEFKSSSE